MLDYMEKNQVKDFTTMPQNDMQIRLAELKDIVSITEIYNEAVANGVATFDTEEKSIENRQDWLLNRATYNPVLVSTIEEVVVAWASLNSWSERAAYNGTAEVSIYVHKDHRGKGVGGYLFKELIREAEKVGLHYLLSRITEGNQTSIDLHLQNGFSVIGVMHEVGFKFGKYLDVTLMEKIIQNQK